MAELDTLRVCSKFVPVPLTHGWDRWDFSFGWLRRRAAERNALLDEGKAAALLQKQMPSSWSGRTFIFPRTARWFFCGLVPRRFVAAMRQENGNWQLVYRSVNGGFGRDDYLLAEIS